MPILCKSTRIPGRKAVGPGRMFFFYFDASTETLQDANTHFFNHLRPCTALSLYPTASNSFCFNTLFLLLPCASQNICSFFVLDVLVLTTKWLLPKLAFTQRSIKPLRPSTFTINSLMKQILLMGQERTGRTSFAPFIIMNWHHIDPLCCSKWIGDGWNWSLKVETTCLLLSSDPLSLVVLSQVLISFQLAEVTKWTIGIVLNWQWTMNCLWHLISPDASCLNS